VADPNNREVGNWSFDEGSGTTVIDTSGYDNHGSFVGAPIWTTGVKGSGLFFDGNGARITVPDAPFLDITQAITIAAWIQPNNSDSQYVIKKASYNMVDGYELSLSSRGVVFVRFNQAGSGNTYKMLSTGGYPLDGSTWMHVAATYDGQEIKLFLDGLLDSSIPASGLLIGTNNNSLSIGAQDDGYRPFEGSIDQVHIYSSALSQAEILDLIQEESQTDPNETPLDSDNDGMPDDWENLWGFNPFDAGMKMPTAMA
jgi:hypothetical protein